MSTVRYINSKPNRVINSRVAPLDEEGDVGAAKDGPGPVFRPASASQFPLVASGITAPQLYWDCQDASGNLVDQVTGGVLTASGSVAYQQAVTGWNAKAVGATAEAAGTGFYTTAGGTLWNIGTESILALFYGAILISTGNRAWFVAGATNNLQLRAVTAGNIELFVNGVAAAGTFVYENNVTPTVYPFALTWDRRAAGTVKFTSNKEEVVGTFAALTDGAKGFGASTLAQPTGRLLMAAVWKGAAAEAMMDRGAGLGAKQLITDLLWPMAF